MSNLPKCIPQKCGVPLRENMDASSDDTVTIKIANFYVPTCGWSQRLLPTWEQLTEKYKNDSTVQVSAIDCSVNPEMCGKYKIEGYPTVLLKKKDGKVIEFEEERSVEALSNFIERNK